MGTGCQMLCPQTGIPTAVPPKGGHRPVTCPFAAGHSHTDHWCIQCNAPFDNPKRTGPPLEPFQPWTAAETLAQRTEIRDLAKKVA